MNDRWLKLYAMLEKNPIINEPDLVYAWVRILLNVNYRSKRILVQDDVVLIQPGQSIRSYESWGELLNFSKNKVIRIMKKFKNLGMIDISTIGGGNRRKLLITVCKWGRYQSNTESNNIDNNVKCIGMKETNCESDSYSGFEEGREPKTKTEQKNAKNATKKTDCESDSYSGFEEGREPKVGTEIDRSWVPILERKNIKNNNIKNNKVKNKSIVENEFRHPSQFSSNDFMKKDEEKSEGEVLIKSESISSKKDSIPPADFSEDVLKIYEAYPSTCFENRSRRLKSRKKNCKTIERILKKKEFEKEKLLKIISKYVDSCKPIPGEFVPPLKGFDTFLNNIPDYTDKELGYVAEEKILDDDRFFFGAKFDEDMLEGFGGLDRIICMRFLHGEFKEFRFVQTTEIKNGTRGEYRFGWDSLTADSFKFHEDRDFADDERMVLRADKTHRDEDKLKYLDI
jgi:hypothetical protein